MNKEIGIKLKKYIIGWREENKEEIKKYRRKYYQEHKEKEKEYQKNQYQEHKEEIKKYHLKNKEKRNEQLKKYRQIPQIKIKIKTRSETNRKIKIPKGYLCEICYKNLAIEKHHEDYNKPLEVLFLCVKCHNKIKKEVKNTNGNN